MHPFTRFRPAYLLSAALLALVAAPQVAHAMPRNIDLEYSRPAPAETLNRSVTVVVVDARDAGKPLEDPSRIGNLRTTIGIPWPVKTRDVAPDRILGALVSDGLRAVGFEAWPGREDGGDRVRVVLEKFWCDGYMRLEMRVRARLEFLPAGSSEPIWTGVLSGGGGVTMVAISQQGVDKELRKGFQRALDDGLESLLPQLRDLAKR